LFSRQPFINAEIVEALQTEFGDELTIELDKEKFGVFGFIQGIKVDLVKHPHLMLKEPENIDGVRMYSTEDIIAMKVNAILGRGKKKDFWDVAELLQHYSVKDFIEFNEKKYPARQLLITTPQALIYFDDAEESEDPISLKGQTWEAVKKSIQEKVRDYLR